MKMSQGVVGWNGRRLMDGGLVSSSSTDSFQDTDFKASSPLTHQVHSPKLPFPFETDFETSRSRLRETFEGKSHDLERAERA